MKLLHVAVEGCGRFGQAARIEGLGPGVNILSAGNEAGKSTLFRAIRTCLFERHNTTKEEVALLATEGLSLPLIITVGFEKAGHSYEIKKSFLRAKSASLSRDGVELARGAEADEEVWKLLGIEQRTPRSVDEAAYGILWVEQGRSFETPEPSEGARSAFNAVIQQEVGTLVGGERARLLLNAVNEELAAYVTKTGQPKANGPLDAAEKQRRQLTDALLEAETLLGDLRNRIDRLDELRRELKLASDPAALQALQDQHAEAQRRLAAAEKAAAVLKRLEEEERDAHHLAEAQQEKLAGLTERAAAIDAQRQHLKRLAEELAPFDAQEEEASKALAEALAAKAQREDALEALERREAELQRLEALGQKLARRAEREARLARLKEFRARSAANEAALKAASVDDAAIAALEAIEREEARIRAAMEAGAARLTIAAKPGSGVTLNGIGISGEAQRAVTEPLAIQLGADVSITISPPAEAREAAAAALAAVRDKLNALLARHGQRSAANMRQRRAERLAVEDEARELKAARAALGLREAPGVEIERLAAEIAGITADAERLLPAGSPPLPPPEAIGAEREALAERRGALRAERSSLEAQAHAHKDGLTKLAERRSGLRGQREAIHAQLESALALLPDDRRETVIGDCAAELSRRRDTQRIKATALERERANAPPADEEERQKVRRDRFAAAISAQKKKAEELREAIARLEGEVQIAGGDGIGEQAAALRLQQEMATAEAARLTERVAVLKLLRDTVQGCHDRRRAELNAPLLRHLRPFLNDVFPAAELALGENFAISGLSRSGPAAELFGKLSLGTQEQVAVLVRLAMGAMICERGEDVPVILDDALVFSDDARIEQMFDAISRAGRSQQVIVLTCRARSFASLGGRQLKIV